jgi:23S rRNA (pseudouridine1915-N3)-methyltransferase
MRVVLACIGRTKVGAERTLAERYIERAALAGRGIGLPTTSLVESDESRARRPADRMAEEAGALRASVPPGAILVTLDERGKSMDSPTFAARLGRARDDGAPAFVLAIGGPDGLAPELRTEAALVLAFGAMTWPHQLVRIMAAEQIYRAVTILAGHPYHRV